MTGCVRSTGFSEVVLTAPRRDMTRTMRRRSSNMRMFVILFAAAAVIIAAGSGAVLFGIGQELESVGASSGVGITASVSGNDLIVHVMDGGRAAELMGVFVSIGGVALSPESAQALVPEDGSDVVFAGAAYGIVGDKYVVVKGYFRDGATATLLASSVSFG